MRRELWIVGAFTVLLSVLFLGKAYHIDEPLYLPVARQILRDPLRPYDFRFNWYGVERPYREINNTPPLLHYALALALKVTGGGEWPMRLFFLPFDLIAAISLYLLAARFLKRPLLPALIVIASPAWLINMPHLMAEKPALALGLAGLYALVRGADEKRPRWYWSSALLLGAAMLSKYNAAVFLLAGVGYSLACRVPLRRIAGHAAVALSGIGLWLVMDAATRGGAAWLVTSQALALPTARWDHKIRSILAFTGGCGLVTAFWSFIARKPRAVVFGALLAATAFLFSPLFDLAPVVQNADRLVGVVFAVGAAWGLRCVFQGREGGGFCLWRPWTAAALLVLLAYWSVMARLVLFLVPPLVFAAAEELEGRLGASALKKLYLASLAAVLAVSLPLALVDYRYAGAQKEIARDVLTRYATQGRRVWCAGHWGLQYYLESGGALMLDASSGGWDRVRPGDVVVVPRVNSNVLRPSKPLAADVRLIPVESGIPLRLLSGWTGEGGFYSNVTGFLPFSFSRESLDEFEVVEPR